MAGLHSSFLVQCHYNWLFEHWFTSLRDILSEVHRRKVERLKNRTGSVSGLFSILWPKAIRELVIQFKSNCSMKVYVIFKPANGIRIQCHVLCMPLTHFHLS